MPKLTKDDYKARFSEFFGESPDDKNLTFMEDLTDTLDELFAGGGASPGNGGKTYTEEEYKALDASWRKKYTERFYTPVPEKKPEEDKESKENKEKERLESIKLEDLFEKR